jgi:hypothetical protein
MITCQHCGATDGPFVKSAETGNRWICIRHLPYMGDRREARGTKR